MKEAREPLPPVHRTVPVAEDREVTFVLSPDLRDPIAQFIADHTRCPPQPLQDLLLQLVKPGDVVVDVGAHIGTVALRAAALGCRVLALEGGPENIAQLEASRAYSQLTDLHIRHAAAGDRTGRIAFGPHLAWGHVRKMVGDDMASLSLAAVTVESALADLGWERADVVKINVEGWERRVLTGMRGLLARPDAPLVFLQSNGLAQQWYQDTPAHVLALLADAGYTLYLFDRTRPSTLIPWNPADAQPEPIADFLAAKTLPASLGAWQVAGALDRDQVLHRLQQTAAELHPPYRGYPALVLREADEALLGHPQIQEMLARLRSDPDPDVRGGAAWSSGCESAAGISRWVDTRRRGGGGGRPGRDPYLALDREASSESGVEQFRIVTLGDGVEVTFVSDGDPIDLVSEQLVHHGLVTEDPPIAFALACFGPGIRFLDLGAHVGTYSLPAAALGCRVIAIEGSTRNAGLLRRAALRNGFANLEVINAVVSGSSGRIAFGAHFAWGHVRKITEDDETTSVEMDAVTVDDVLHTRGWDGVDFLKMDIEGWEVDALPGMARLLSRPDAPILLFENNGPGLAWYARTPVDLLEAVSAFGYLVYLVDRDRPKRLVRWARGTLQPVAIADYVAVKRPAQLPADWEIAEPFSDDDLAKRFGDVCRDPSPFYRSYAAIALRDAPISLLSRADVREGLGLLRQDVDDDVRAVSGWSASLEPPFGIDVYFSLHRQILADCRAKRRTYGALPAGMATLPDPYVIRRTFGQFEVDVLIADVGGRNWYDVGHVQFVDLDAIRDLSLITPGDTVFDVGAHQGFYSMCFAKMAGPSGYVYAFELLRPNCDIIEFNGRLNGLTNLTVTHAAVGDRTGTITASDAEASVAAEGEPDVHLVPAIRLDDWIDKAPRFVKIDAEGFEGFVLKGASGLLATQPNITIEIDARSGDRFGMSMKDTAALVDWSPYDVWWHSDRSPTFKRRSWRNPLKYDVGMTIMARRRGGWAQRLRTLFSLR